MSDAIGIQSFGVRAAAVSSPTALLDLEEAEHKRDLFARVDDLLGDLLVRAFCGTATLQIDNEKLAVWVPDLSPLRLGVLEELYALANQHSHGVWFIPEQVTIKAGLQNLAWYFATYPRFATGIALDAKIRLAPAGSPTAIMAWAATEPLFEQLFVPFDLRGRAAGTKAPEDQLTAWSDFDELVGALGLDLEGALTPMRYGGGWGRLRAPEQLAAKQQLLAAMAAQASPLLAARYRAHRLVPLIAHYYDKAKGGVAKRRTVITKAYQKDLSAFFGGDWLLFLDYLGEQPDPDEQIESALPEVKLMVGGARSAASVAESLGLPPQEVEQALSTYWGEGEGPQPAQTSPVERRVAILRDFWRQFDEVHAQQAPGMKALWGLVQDGPSEASGGWQGPEWYHPGLYRNVLADELVRSIDEAWGTTMLARWPEHIVTNLSPHGSMAASFGPALEFWHGIGLTAWFICEGPYSRTDLAGLADYYASRLNAMAGLGCPVDPSVFEELKAADAQLGPPEPITEERSLGGGEVSNGLIKLTYSMSSQIGTRRSGFEGLRDLITRLRREWAERYLDTYLHARWDTEIREAARMYFQLMADRQKAPTPKQFARHAALATDHWFGGDLRLFYGAIGEKSPLEPVRVSLMPADPKAFAEKLFTELGGQPSTRKRVVADRDEYEENSEAVQRSSNFHWLANQSLHFIQLQEAMGHAPEVAQFGRQSFEYRSAVLSDDPEAAWQRYVDAVESALHGDHGQTDQGSPLPADPSMLEAQSTSAIPPPPPPSPPPPSPSPSPSAPPPPPSAGKRRRWFGRAH